MQADSFRDYVLDQLAELGLARGMGPFRPNARQTLTSYYEVPPDILEDGELLAEWARTALAANGKAAARRKSAGRKRPGPTRKPRK